MRVAERQHQHPLHRRTRGFGARSLDSLRQAHAQRERAREAIASRMDPGEVEYDDHGIYQATEEACEHGKAVGVSYTRYLPDPSLWLPERFDRHPETERILDWLTERYPRGLEFTYDGANGLISVSLYADYHEGEDSGALVDRMFAESDYSRLDREGFMLSTLIYAWDEHVGATDDDILSCPRQF
jgi:hypothetical protein